MGVYERETILYPFIIFSQVAANEGPKLGRNMTVLYGSVGSIGMVLGTSFLRMIYAILAVRACAMVTQFNTFIVLFQFSGRTKTKAYSVKLEWQL